MPVRKFRVKDSFMISVAGRPRVFAADKLYTEDDIVGVPKRNMSAFVELVEQATAAPGEKRAVGRPKKKPVEAPPGEEPVDGEPVDE